MPLHVNSPSQTHNLTGLTTFCHQFVMRHQRCSMTHRIHVNHVGPGGDEFQS